MSQIDLVLSNATCVIDGQQTVTNLGVNQGRISHIGGGFEHLGRETLDCRGLHILPGVIDSQVHFREPGIEHKEDLATGTAGACLGGITAVFEMPNTKPPTTTLAALDDKVARCKDRIWSHTGFYAGVSHDNLTEVGTLEKHPNCVGIKVFMGSSTASLILPDEKGLSEMVKRLNRCFSVHAEDEDRLVKRKGMVEGSGDPSLHPEWRDVQSCVLATEKILRVCQSVSSTQNANGAKKRVHILHITTAEEVEIISRHLDFATGEVTPQHLTLFAPDCYERLGTYAQMNPPIRDKKHQDALWKGVERGVLSIIGSDHAPHTRAEKDQPYPTSPSGMPGVQTLLPVMLNHVNAGRMSLEQLVLMVTRNPARRFGLKNKGEIAIGYDADLTIIDLKRHELIENCKMATRSGWTPFDGMKVQGWPVMTVINGEVKMREGELIGKPSALPLKFN